MMSLIQIQKELLLKHYKYENTIGHGAFGIVSCWQLRKKSRHLEINHPRKLAVKQIKSRNSDPHYSTYLERERSCIKVVMDEPNPNPNVIRYFGFIELDSEVKIIMELATMDLRTHLEIKKDLEFDYACNIAEQILNGLKYLHAKCIAHRDLKPQNMLLTWAENNEMNTVLKLCDFGLSRQVSSDPESIQSYSLVGTKKYLSPELRAGAVNEITLYGNSKTVMVCDIFAAGVVVIELFSPECKRKEFSKSPGKFVHTNILIEDLIKKMTDHKASRRPDAQEASLLVHNIRTIAHESDLDKCASTKGTHMYPAGGIT
jgi:serine/threonine protein kinase